VTVTNNAPAIFGPGTNVVTWTAVDGSGNVSTCPQLVVVLDHIPPTITCPSNLLVAANSGCGATNVSLGSPVASDNCGTVTLTNNAPAIFGPGTNVVTWTATDTSGNVSTCQQFVVVRDQTAPTITCPSNITVAANAGCNATNVALGTPATSDNCGVLTVTNNAPASFALGTNVVTWTVVDTSGNTATCPQLVIVRDQTAPTLTCPSNLVVSANSGCNATNVTLGTAVATDNCGTVTVTNNAPASFGLGTNVVTWTAVDGSGNVSTCPQLVVVRDQTPPTITCPSNLLVAANSGCGATNVSLGSPVASDNCGTVTVTNNAPAIFGPGTNVVTWTAVDTSGNLATCQQLVVVKDQTAPTITCPSNITVAANAGCNATNVSLGSPATSDNCGILAVSNNAPAVFALGTNVVTWTVVDTSGNVATCAQLVVVRDQTAPTLTCPSNLVVAANSGCAATNVALGSAVATDNCGTVTVTNNAPASFGLGTNVVTWTAVDGSGNVSTCTQLVVVRDQTPPAITCPANLQVAANSGCGATNVALGAPVASDNCGTVTVTNNAPVVFGPGTNVVTWTAVDTSGNLATCQQLVVVSDQTPPTLTCPSNLVVAANSGCAATNVALGTPVASVPCGTVTVTNNAPALFNPGTNLVTWTAVSSSGNLSTCVQMVVVRDMTVPTIVCPSNITVAANSGCSATNVNLGNPVASDNCGLSTVTNNAPASFALGLTTVTWTAVDTSGNTATCQQLVIVRDQTAPTITCPSNIVLSTDPGKCSASNVTYSATAADNCSGTVTLAYSPPSGSTFAKGTNLVTCTATDTAGNSNSCAFTVTVLDTEPPAITCQTNVTVSAQPGQAAAAVSFPLPAATDNCPGVSVVATPPSGSSFPIGTTTVTCTATDASGNTNSCTFTITVKATPVGGLVAGFVTSPMVLNRQTGLFEQSAGLTNMSSSTVTNARLYVLGLPSTNTLYNRAGAALPTGFTNPTPFVQASSPLAPSNNVVFLLEFYIPNLVPITNLTLFAEAAVPVVPPVVPPGSVLVPLVAGRSPLVLNNGRFLLEWASLPGRTYLIQYSSDLATWKTVEPALVATATSVQWLDDGPPKTDTKPSLAGNRYYRVYLLPAN
jgi:hypothetical protein